MQLLSLNRLSPRKSLFALAGIVALLGAASSGAQAAPINLFSTGQNVAEGAVDPFYRLIAAPSGVTLGSSFVTVSDGFPIGPWMANTSGVKWIEPTSGTTDTHPVGSYTYRTTFSLAGLNAGTAQVSLALASDNSVTNVMLNGVALGAFNTSFTAESAPININSGFVGGTNTLDFTVSNAATSDPNNASNPTGLRVHVLGATASAVPEPASAALLLFMAPVVLRRARKRA